MTYNTLKNIADQIKMPPLANFPYNAFQIVVCNDLSLLDYRNWNASNGVCPINRDGVAYLLRFPATGSCVVYNPKADCINFWIMHEFAHYLLKHQADPEQNEEDADLLACILIAPEEEVLPRKLDTAEKLLQHCGIPIDAGKLYIELLQPKFQAQKATSDMIARIDQQIKAEKKRLKLYSAVMAFLVLLAVCLGVYIVGSPIAAKQEKATESTLATTSGEAFTES